MSNETEREPTKFMAKPELRKALKLRAAYEDSNITQVIVDALHVWLKTEIEEVRRRELANSTEANRETAKLSHR